MLVETLKFKHNCVIESLNEQQADAFLFVGKVNRFWLTGISTQDGYVLVTRENIYLFVDKRDFDYCKAHLNSAITLVEYTGYKSIDELCNELEIHNICFDADHMSVQEFNAINEAVEVDQFIPVNSQELRKYKCAEEIKTLQASADIAVAAIADCRKWLKPGVTEIQTSNHIRDFMLKKGASGVSFDLIVAFGWNTANPHHQPGDTVLQNEMLVTLDIGCIYKGYCSDITRTFYVGKNPSQDIQDLYNVVFYAQKLGLEVTRPENTGKLVDWTVRNFIENHRKYRYGFTHNLGHGVGLEIHELPGNRAAYDRPLGVNSVVTVEPGIYIDGLGGVRIEDTVVVTPKGLINLTVKAPKDFLK